MSTPKPDHAATPAEGFETTLLASSDTGPRPASKPGVDSAKRWTGAHLDHFRIGEPLARGGMGVVYSARDESLDRRVAIKFLPDELADQHDLQERFIREARAQARLNSPNVAQIYYIGRTPADEGHRGTLYFAMELVKGGALDQVLERGERLDPEHARQLMLEVARGLSDANAAGIIHRDIKPSNLLLDANGAVKIADFGVAKPVDGGDDIKITQDGAVVGSPLYLPPEQAKGETVDLRADMYSIGCTFYHLMTGKPPFDGPTPLAVVSKHMSEPAPTIADAVATVPPRISTIVEKLMRKSPADRFGSYDELITALEAAAPEATEHAGFWVRGAALMVDVAIAGGLIWLVGWPGLALHLVYVTAATAWRGQTIGKYLFNLEVRRLDGSPLGPLRAVARTIVSLWLPFLAGLTILLTEGHEQLGVVIERMQPTELAAFQTLVVAIAVGNALLSLLFVAGLALAAFHPQKRAAHDLVIGSQVVYRLRKRRPTSSLPDSTTTSSG